MLTRRDRAVAGGLLLTLAILAAATVWPSVAPAGTVSPAPSPSPEEVVAYREGMLGRPTSVSPFGARTAADRALVALVFSGLVRLGPGESFVADLADRWSVDETGASWTFVLRSGATWHDGLPVTAADVQFTVRALQDPEYDGPGAGSWRDVTVAAIDERTVRFSLAHPIGGFLALATQPIAPAHLLEGVPAGDLSVNPFGQRPVGSGPYRLLDWNAGEASLEAVGPATIDPGPTASEPPPDSLASPPPTPTPSRPMPWLERLELKFYMDPVELAAAFRAGELDAVSGLDPATAGSLAELPDVQVLRYPRSTLTAVLFDQRPTRREFQDVRTRRALVESIDRDAIVETELGGFARRADAPIPPTSWAFDGSASRPLTHDPKVAAEDLTAAGWTKLPAGGWSAPGSTAAFTLELLTPDAGANPVAAAVAAAVAADWRELGLTVSVRELPPAMLVERLRSGEFAAALIDLAVGVDPDLYPVLASSQTIAGGPNVSGIQDPVLDGKLEAARRPGTIEARTTAYAELQTYLAANVPLGPIAWRDEVVILSEAVSGPTVRRLGEAADRFYDVLTWRLAVDR
jgi:peptide/nickel transport system substrate-binding protein